MSFGFTARALDDVIPKYSSAAVIGAGAISVEIAMALVARGYRSVYLLDVMENVLPASLDKDMANRIERVMSEKGIELILPSTIISVRSESGRK